MPAPSKTQATTISASTAETNMIFADPAFRTQITGLVITTTNALPSTLTIRDYVGGNIRLVVDYPNSAAIPGAPLVLSFNPPLGAQTFNSNSAWTLQASANANAYKILATFQEA
jgi:hypothetical protein